MRYLAILLLAPWLLILCWAYWTYPKHLPRTPGRRMFDLLALALTLLAAAFCALLGFDGVELPVADAFGRASGVIWQQVRPALYGYGAFIAVLLVALALRQFFWGRRR